MKTIKIYKAMLLWATIVSVLIFIMGLESMMEEKRWTLIVVWAVINLLFCWMCRNILTIRDFYKLSLTQYIERALR